jgi:hypothetical protein
MDGDSGYALQKLELSVIDLAVGEGDVRSRLSSVYYEHLHVLKEHDFPDKFKREWASIIKALNDKGPKSDEDGVVYVGSLLNTLNRIRNKTGSKIASDIVLLSQNLRAYFDDLSSAP